MKLLYERDGQRISFPIEEGETFIGRKDYCDLCFPDPSVSKRHVKLVRHGARVELFDAGSRNGTLLNGKIVTRQELVAGDVIQIGKITLEVQDERDGAGRRSDAYPARQGISEVPSDEEFDRERSPRTNARGDSFKDFDDFDSRPAQAGRGDSQEPRQHTRTQAERPGIRNSVASRTPSDDVRDTMPPNATTTRGSGPPSARADDEPPPQKSSGDAGGAIARFTAVEGPDKGRVFEVRGTTATIGTKAENAVPIRGDGVSRYHAEVTLEGEKWILKDLGSRNGLFVSGKKIDVHELAAGDEVQIGTVRLRFDFEAAKAPPLLPRDPKALAKDPRVRKVVAGIVVAAAVVLMVMPGAQQSQGPVAEEDFRTSIAKVVADLRADKLDTAKDGATKLSRRFGEKATPRTLVDAIGIWEEKPKPFSFRWEKAQQVFDELHQNGATELGPSGMEWVEQCSAYVKANFPWWRKVEEANEQQREGDKRRGSGDVSGARDAYLRALDTYKSVPKETAFADHADQQFRRVRLAVYGVLRNEGEKRMKEAKTADDWKAAEDFLTAATAQTDDQEQVRAIKALTAECDLNREAEKLYNDALALIGTRDPQKYPESLTLLQRIDKRARVYVEAQGVIAWVGADLKVRQARDEYDLMNIERAIKLLDESLKVEQIGKDAQDTIRQRLARWKDVARAFEEARLAYESDPPDFAKSERLFRRVLELEPSPTNRYRVFARRYLEYIDSSAKQKVSDRAERGFQGLKANPPEWDEAYGYFQSALRDAGMDKDKLRQKIERAVAEAEHKGKWFDHGQRDFMTDRVEELPRLRDLFRLLKDYLPKTSEMKKKSADLFRQVCDRLKLWEKQ